MKNTMKKASNSKNIIRSIDEKHALVTKSFAKKAQIFGTEEFFLWREYLSYCPKAKMVTKNIKKKADKKVVTKHMTYENMKLFISLQEDHEILMAEFNREVKLSKIKENPYRAVLAWFLEKFENVNAYKVFYEELNAKKAKEKEENIYKSAKEKFTIEEDDDDDEDEYEDEE